MRSTLLVPLLLALVLLPTAPADTGRGALYGADARVATAGLWDMWFVYVSTTGRLDANLTWADSALHADYDLTLWRAGAADNGILEESEILARSWQVSTAVRRENVSAAVAPSPRPYVLTVEAIQAQGEAYTLTETGGRLVQVCHLVSPPFACVPAAQGVKVTKP